MDRPARRRRQQAGVSRMSAVDDGPGGSFWTLPGEHAEIAIERVGEFPLLAECLAVMAVARLAGCRPRSIRCASRAPRSAA